MSESDWNWNGMGMNPDRLRRYDARSILVFYHENAVYRNHILLTMVFLLFASGRINNNKKDDKCNVYSITTRAVGVPKLQT
jgi:hypothetical protein